MAISQDKLRNVFAKLVDASPNKLTVTIDSENYCATKTNLSRAIRYSEYGISNDYTFSVIINEVDLIKIPEVDDLCTVKDVIYRIIGMEVDSVDISRRIDLGQRFA